MELTEIVIKNEIKVTVPDSPNLMTHYVLREQGDWFEDEIEFIRRYIKPGMKVIDIGANYGVYTLTIAKQVGEGGKVWAFEPASATAHCLEQSIKSNNFRNVKLIQAGLSNTTGKATLYLSDNSELNSMTKVADTKAASESIRLLTLDYCLNEYKWHDIDFIKLDAEGEESNILKKGKSTLSALSPLIMFELKHGNTINQPLIKRFNEMGYGCYRLVPGLNVLIPFNMEDAIDAYQLNLFACKADKAEKLIREDVIVKSWDAQQAPPKDIVDNSLVNLGYWRELAPSIASEKDNEYEQLFAAYLSSRCEDISNSSRLGFLMLALHKAKSMLARGELAVGVSCTLARVAFDAGERKLGVDILGKLIDKYRHNLNFEIKAPFLPASRRYEDVAPQGNVKNWLFASMLEQFLQKYAYSSYFSPQLAGSLFALLKNTGFMGTKMQNRQEVLSGLLN